MPHHLVMAAEDAAVPAGRDTGPAAAARVSRTMGTPLARSGSRLELGPSAAPPASGMSAAPPASGAGAGLPASGADAGLPRRLRQASLAPQLREPGSPAQPPSGDGQPETRSADQARNLISSIQRGWRNGRTTAGQPDGSADGSPGRFPGGGPGPRATPDEAGR